MRINNVEYPNVSIRVIESKRVVGLTGPKSIHLYEAKLLQKSEMRKDIVIELSYKGFG